MLAFVTLTLLGLQPLGKETMEAHIQRGIHLSQREGFPVPPKRIGGRGCRLVMTFLFERRVVGSSCKDIHTATIKMAKGLL